MTNTNDRRHTCPTCSGRGVIFTPEDLDHTSDNWYEECPECSGSGIVQHGDTDSRFVALSTEDYITTLAMIGNAWALGAVGQSFVVSFGRQYHDQAVRAHSHAIDYAVRCASI